MCAANFAFLTAVYHDELSACRTLVDEKALIDPATASFDGVNALVVALASPLARRNDATALWLLKKNCDPFAVDGCGVSAVTVACADETTSMELLDYFADAAGEDATKRVHFVDACCLFKREDVLRRFASRRDASTSTSPVRRRLAEATFRYAMDVDAWHDAWVTSVTTEDEARTGAHVAAFVGRRDFFESDAFDARATMDARDRVGRTPLAYAIDGRQSVEFIEFLIYEMGADVDARADEPYGSALRHACRVRRADVVETLLRASNERADADADVVETLLRASNERADAGANVDAGANADAFVAHTAFGFFTGDARVVDLLTNAGYDFVAPCAKLGWPPLFYLIDSTARDVTRQPGRREEILRARTPLVARALREHARAGDADARCESGRTALMLAAAHDLSEVCETILDVTPQGAMARVDGRGRAAFHWACHRASEKTLKMFKTRGLLDRATRERRDADGATGGDLLAASYDSPRKHHPWPDPISRDDVFDQKEAESAVDVAAAVALAQRRCVELFDVDVFRKRPKTCATCFRLTTDPKRCGRCRAKVYCSLACQKLDWPEHRRDCENASPSLRETLAKTPETSA